MEHPFEVDIRSCLSGALNLSTGETPFPWQEELLDCFIKGKEVTQIDIPTGLGKTSVIAIWLVARALGAQLPRRLVYVVDRRAVVDQATEVAEYLQGYVDKNPKLKQSLNLVNKSLPVSTLRGQHADNKEWLEDPTSPAIIVGTVDMIGSRLLFHGYCTHGSRTGRKMWPYHAGFIGVDSLIVLDEAHLVKPFESLIRDITGDKRKFGAKDEALQSILPPFKLLSLSATGELTSSNEVITLTASDFNHPVVNARYEKAIKRLRKTASETDKIAEKLAEEAWDLVNKRSVRCIVFCDKREDAEKCKKLIEKKARNENLNVMTELFVGGRRVFERQNAAKELETMGFIPKAKKKCERPAFLFATSAAEVGVNIDADCMVCDMVPWERLVQRLGRVNRYGDVHGGSDIVLIDSPDKKLQKVLEKKPDERTDSEKEELERYHAIQNVLGVLPHSDDVFDVGLKALYELKRDAKNNSRLMSDLKAATTPTPIRPALTKAVIDSWSMTSLKEHTGRPDIDPWLRGWMKDDKPQTAVIWRKYLPVRKDEKINKDEVEDFFEAAPLHLSEILETDSYRVKDWLSKRAEELLEKTQKEKQLKFGEERIDSSDIVAIALSSRGDFVKGFSLKDLTLSKKDKKNGKRENIENDLNWAILFVNRHIAGLKDGMLDSKEETLPRTIDDGESWMGSPPFRIIKTDGTFNKNTVWLEIFRFPLKISGEGEPTQWLIVEKYHHEPGDEGDWYSVSHPQLLSEHEKETEKCARFIADRLALPKEYKEALVIAASLHDEGKAIERWQLAFRSPTSGIYGKTMGPINFDILGGYRHELGSLIEAEKNPQLENFASQHPHLRGLILHLIAAHHGFSRPVIGVDGYDAAPPSVLQDRQKEISLRFSELQDLWGPWGLAWWEALLRAADHQASRNNNLVINKDGQMQSEMAITQATTSSIGGGS